MKWRGLTEPDAGCFIMAGGTAGVSYWTVIFPVSHLKDEGQAGCVGK